MQNHTAMVHLEYKTTNPYSARYTIGTLTTPLCVRSTYVMATAYSTRQPQTALPNLYDLTGQRFEHLVVQSYAYSKDENRCWNCLCDCGNTTVVTTEWLRKKKGFPACCGCLYPKKVLVGNRYDRLVVLELLTGRKARCLCDCGKETLVFRNNLPRGNTGSCGCWHIERFTHIKHQMVKTREYRSWTMMKNRCLSPMTPGYRHYGARGIRAASGGKTI